ncbi:MAG: hypothetical protein PHF18_08310 [Methanosarcina sp.]|uniref:hypothetical protein n=1 Tax=Methanosarcina sp. TaxID=2213 RepID=UPI0026191FE1|nr:hypothetical protein [Methanosarcina sp.]MDD3246838.1 hypothetical protein [Methanosarcina sp.]MDD4250171.1 hypothetical protein [Methanosarcina sp.]
MLSGNGFGSSLIADFIFFLFCKNLNKKRRIHKNFNLGNAEAQREFPFLVFIKRQVGAVHYILRQFTTFLNTAYVSTTDVILPPVLRSKYLNISHIFNKIKKCSLYTLYRIMGISYKPITIGNIQRKILYT